MIEIMFRKSGNVTKQIKILFPGYIFIKTEIEYLNFLSQINRIIQESNTIINVLKKEKLL